MLREISRFGGCDALVNHVRSFRRRQPQFPDLVVALAAEMFREIDVSRSEAIGIEPAFAKNVCCANHGILAVRTGLAFEAQCFFEIERDYRWLGVLEHEVAQRADRDLRSNSTTLGLTELRMTRIDFFLCRFNQRVQQV